MLIGVCSLKGSPGVTTTALALAAHWPSGEALVIEADPAGGDLAARFGLTTTPGVVSLAAAARRESTAELLGQHCQQLPGGLRVAVGPLGGKQTHATLQVLTSRRAAVLRQAAAQPGTTVVVDLGRLEASSPAWTLVGLVDVLLVAAHPTAEGLSHVNAAIADLSTATARPGLVLLGEGYARGEVEHALGVPVLAELPRDPAGAAVLCGAPRVRGLQRSPLARASRRLAHTVASFDPKTPSEPSPQPPATSADAREEEQNVEVGS